MRLTPIRVRGKRGQPKPVKKTSAKGKQTADLDGPSETKRVKRHREKNDDAAGGRMKKGLPRLSQLPQEVLECAFIASKNLSLPLVSHELYHRLSTDSVKYQLVGAAFGPTWDAWYGLDNAELYSYGGWKSDAARIEGDPAFQSAVLACSWAKLPMLLKSFDVWIRQHAHGRIYFAIPELKEERLRIAPEPGSLYDRAYNTGLATPEGPLLSTMAMREKLNYDLGMFQRRFPTATPSSQPGTFNFQSVDEVNYLQALLSTHLEVHPGTSVPDDLLSGPFESEEGDVQLGEEKMHRLFWLVRGGACLQDEQTWEVTRQGFREIVQLITGGEPGAIGNDDVTRRIQLASRLFALLGVLGVFENQWPKYILQTHLTQVRTQALHWPPGSAQEILLNEITSKLQQILGNQRGFQFKSSWRWWRRPKDDDAYPPLDHRLQLPLLRQIRMQRARFFLLALDGEGQQQSAVLAEHDDSPGGVVVHEPWSDFGPDL